MQAGVIGPGSNATASQRPQRPWAPVRRAGAQLGAAGDGTGLRAGAAVNSPVAAGLTGAEWARLVTASERCSVLIKVTGDLGDLFMVGCS